MIFLMNQLKATVSFEFISVTVFFEDTNPGFGQFDNFKIHVSRISAATAGAQ
jgi:hypothetical protein